MSTVLGLQLARTGTMIRADTVLGPRTMIRADELY